MISNQFRSAAINEANQQNQLKSTRASGVKDLSIAIVGAMGFSGSLGDNIVSDAAQHVAANRVGGIGGNIMMATLQEKQASAKQQQQLKLGKEQIASTVETTLGDNPIHRSAIKELTTVFDKMFSPQVKEEVNNDNDR